MNCYIVWTEGEYFLFISARSHGQARYEYARFGDWEYEVFDATLSGHSTLHVNLVEKNIEWEGVGDITDEYVKSREADLVLSGFIDPEWHYERLWEGEEDYDW